MTFWRFWDVYGGNWLLFLAAFLTIEGVAIVSGHRTLSASFWTFLRAHEAGATISLWIGLVCLTGHFIGGWWK